MHGPGADDDAFTPYPHVSNAWEGQVLHVHILPAGSARQQSIRIEVVPSAMHMLARRAQVARLIAFRPHRLRCYMSSHAASQAGGSGGGAKLWGGRFTGKTDPLMEQFNNSMPFDKRMWRADIDGSICYARALSRCGILTEAESAALTNGLQKVGSEDVRECGGSLGVCIADLRGHLPVS